MANTKISWCDKVWNPVTGCTKVSEGCHNCYAEKMAKRLQAMGQPHYANGFGVTCHEDALDTPLRWRKPARIFVNSMSDLFHKDVPIEFIWRIIEIAYQASQHDFLILTKRPERMLDVLTRSSWWNNDTPSNIWLGVSVENQKAVDERIPVLLEIPAAVRFLSCEPLLESVNLKLFGIFRYGDGLLCRNIDLINWVIVGGESGPRYRQMELGWARSIRDQCQNAKIPFFFKQTGGLHHGSDLLDGVEYKEFPA